MTTNGSANDLDPHPDSDSELQVTRGPATGFTVLYDADCPVCRRARVWAEGQDQLVPLRFLPAGGPRARQRFPDLDHASTLIDITTVGDDGAIWRGKSAWVTVLWAVARTRTLANDLAAGRKLRTFGTVVGGTEMLRKAFRSGEAIECTTDACGVVPPSSGAVRPGNEWLPPASEWLPPGAQPDDADAQVRTANHGEP